MVKLTMVSMQYTITDLHWGYCCSKICIFYNNTYIGVACIETIIPLEICKRMLSRSQLIRLTFICL